MENKAKYNALITKRKMDTEYLRKYITENIVKLVFFNTEYGGISSDSEVHEIHKFKSKYRGNTYISIPLKVITTDDDKFITGVDFDYENETPTGFAVVSKHDLRDLSKDMKKAKKDERVAYGKKLCEEYVKNLNLIISDKVFNVTINDSEGNELFNKDIYGEFKDVNSLALKEMDRLGGTK